MQNDTPIKDTLAELEREIERCKSLETIKNVVEGIDNSRPVHFLKKGRGLGVKFLKRVTKLDVSNLEKHAQALNSAISEKRRGTTRKIIYAVISTCSDDPEFQQVSKELLQATNYNKINVDFFKKVGHHLDPWDMLNENAILKYLYDQGDKEYKHVLDSCRFYPPEIEELKIAAKAVYEAERTEMAELCPSVNTHYQDNRSIPNIQLCAILCAGQIFKTIEKLDASPASCQNGYAPTDALYEHVSQYQDLGRLRQESTSKHIRNHLLPKMGEVALSIFDKKGIKLPEEAREIIKDSNIFRYAQAIHDLRQESWAPKEQKPTLPKQTLTV